MLRKGSAVAGRRVPTLSFAVQMRRCFLPSSSTHPRTVLQAGLASFSSSSPVLASVSERLAGAVKAGLLLEDAGQKEAAHQADRCIARIKKYASERKVYLGELKKTGSTGSGGPVSAAATTAKNLSFLDAPSVPATSSEPEVFHPAIKGRPSALHAAAKKTAAAASASAAPHPSLRASSAASSATASVPPPTPPRMPKGLYFFGSVGTGKTQIMDTLIATLGDDQAGHAAPPRPQSDKPEVAVRRMHFHSLLASIHTRLHEMRKQRRAQEQKKTTNTTAAATASPSSSNLVSDRDLIAEAAKELASIATVAVICIDDLELVDVADAFLLDHYFRTLHREGAVLVFSSNWHPSLLYKDGLQKELFAPFQRMLEAVCRIVELQGQDYRQVEGKRDGSGEGRLGDGADHREDSAARLLRDHSSWQTKEVSVSHGRTISVKVPPASPASPAAAERSVALVEFEALCGSESPLGAADFTALALQFKELVVANLPSPCFKRLQHNELRRLIHCLDVFYDLRGSLRIFVAGEGAFLEKPQELARLFAEFLPADQALAPPPSQEDGASETSSSSSLGSLTTKPTVFVSDDDTTAGKLGKRAVLLKDTTDAPASNILSVRVEEAAKATLHMGIRRALSRLIEMARRTTPPTKAAVETSGLQHQQAEGTSGASRAFDALNRAALVEQIPASVKAALK